MLFKLITLVVVIFIHTTESIDDSNPYEDRNGLIDEALHWPYGIVPFTLSPCVENNPVYKKNVLAAMNGIQGRTCIKFKKAEIQDKDYVYFVCHATKCATRPGRAGGKQELLLSDVCFHQTGRIKHEILHVLGFVHMQSDPRRDRFIKIERQNIRPEFQHNFEKYSPAEVSLFNTTYDLGSIMHYSKVGFSKNGKNTIVTYDDKANIGQREDLSDGDVNRINNMYRCLTSKV